ncbi:hypothetical protein EDD86DRAFT_215331 [Gorgonomyces haynaldii]|nr:hypothetical protein EDD86DRAFT_215331 [Gorgonomyces haynaldii]
MWKLFGYVLVALCWGFTNPFIKRATEGIDNVQSNSFIETTFKRIWFLLKPSFIIPLVFNLMGSSFYYYFLGDVELSKAVPITNSLTFVMTLVSGVLFQEYFSTRTMFGMLLVVCGALLALF